MNNGSLIQMLWIPKWIMSDLLLIITIIIIFKVQFVHGMEKYIKLELWCLKPIVIAFND